MLIKVSAVLDRFKRTVSVSLLLFLLLYSNCICFALNGDLDSTDGDKNSMMKTDPNIRIIPNGQGYGKNIPTPNDQLKDKKSEVLKESSEDKSRNTKKRGTKNSDEVQKSISDQTVQAALQFGVLVAVALLVGILFMVNVGVELLCISIGEKFTAKFKTHKKPDIEDLDPASLVGSFKRYK